MNTEVGRKIPLVGETSLVWKRFATVTGNLPRSGCKCLNPNSTVQAESLKLRQMLVFLNIDNGMRKASMASSFCSAEQTDVFAPVNFETKMQVS